MKFSNTKATRLFIILSFFTNSIYHVLLSNAIVLGNATIWVWFLCWPPAMPFQVPLIQVECMAILLFSLPMLFTKLNLKAWLIFLPAQYIIGVLMELGIYSLVRTYAPLDFTRFHRISNPIFLFLRPLVLLAIQTLIIYLRHHRRLRREGEAG